MKLLLCCNFLCLFFQAAGRNSIDSILFKEATILYDKQSYDLSALKYEEIVYCSNNRDIVIKAKLGKAYCKKMQGNYSGALWELNRIAVDQLLNNSLKCSIYHEKALLNYLLDDFMEAEFMLNKMEYFVKDSLLVKNSNYLKCLVLAGLDKWDEVDVCIKTMLDTNKVKLAEYQEYKKHKSLKKAKLLSYLFPGLGQVYAGSIVGGISSSLLQFGALGFTALSFYHGFYFSGALTGIPIFFSLFTGDKSHTVYLVNKRNEKIAKGRRMYLKKMMLSL